MCIRDRLYTLSGNVMLPTVVKTVSKYKVSAENLSPCVGLLSHVVRWHPVPSAQTKVNMPTSPKPVKVNHLLCELMNGWGMLQRCSTSMNLERKEEYFLAPSLLQLECQEQQSPWRKPWALFFALKDALWKTWPISPGIL